VSEEDRAVIERAVAAAKRRNPGIEGSVFNYLRDVLLFLFPENLDDNARAAHTHFVLKFQQSTGPIMAKGLEDTVFYIYNRLAGLNEVGGEPQQFGLSVGAFHQRSVERQRDWPAALLATSTHDTKRSEDVRARMLAISEMPQLWRRSLARWRMLNGRWKRTIEEAEAPDRNEEYLLYQTLLGLWPMETTGQAARTVSPEFVERIQNYMAKALKEAKLNTSWIQPNAPWDSAMHDFVAAILDPAPRHKFLPSFVPVAEEIARLGAINSLSQLVLKLTLPGVPDIYQGNEIWDYTLVDPDNRRPIDYDRRRAMLATVQNAAPDDLLRAWPDGRIKLFVTQRLLRFRREHAEFFRNANYLPLTSNGALADCVLAFAREHEGKRLVVLVTRLSSRVGFPAVGEQWKETAVNLPDTFSLTGMNEILIGRSWHGENGVLRLAEAMAQLPFAVLTNF
jgi:(1->4)-alpha-D-glucan 1-alpha-D-glucosylmutase